MERVTNCFFIGHREAGRELLPQITEAAERLILRQREIAFYTGRYGNFDRLAGEAIILLKAKYPEVRLYEYRIPFRSANALGGMGHVGRS